LFLLLLGGHVSAQTHRSEIDKEQFFKDDSVIHATIALDLKRLFAIKTKNGSIIPAQFTATLDSGAEIQEPVVLEVRGNFRKNYCTIPPLRINFTNTAKPILSPLGSLKLVNSCMVTKESYTYLLKEFLVYKMYNLVTDKSLRVRLLKITFTDNTGKHKPINEFGFLIEDVNDMAKRNQCVER
jgi:hypothetical protein